MWASMQQWSLLVKTVIVSEHRQVSEQDCHHLVHFTVEVLDKNGPEIEEVFLKCGFICACVCMLSCIVRFVLCITLGILCTSKDKLCIVRSLNVCAL